MRLRTVAVLAFLAGAFALASPVGAQDAKTPHPHFKDGGVLSWSTKLADAQAAAKAGDRLVFIEYGRKA